MRPLRGDLRHRSPLARHKPRWIDLGTSDLCRDRPGQPGIPGYNRSCQRAAGNFIETFDQPRITGLTELADFSALANSVPRVIARDALKLDGGDEKVTGRVWAGNGLMLAAIYNDGSTAHKLRAGINYRALAGKYYGFRGSHPVKLTLLGKDGKQAPGGVGAEHRDGDLVLLGTLEPGHLLLVESRTRN